MSRFRLHESSLRRFTTDHELTLSARTMQVFNICDGQRGKLAGVPPEGTNHSMSQASSLDSPRSTSSRSHIGRESSDRVRLVSQCGRMTRRMGIILKTGSRYPLSTLSRSTEVLTTGVSTAKHNYRSITLRRHYLQSSRSVCV